MVFPSRIIPSNHYVRGYEPGMEDNELEGMSLMVRGYEPGREDHELEGMSLMVRGYEPGREDHEFDPRLGNFFLVRWKKK